MDIHANPLMHQGQGSILSRHAEQHTSCTRRWQGSKECIAQPATEANKPARQHQTPHASGPDDSSTAKGMRKAHRPAGDACSAAQHGLQRRQQQAESKHGLAAHNLLPKIDDVLGVQLALPAEALRVGLAQAVHPAQSLDRSGASSKQGGSLHSRLCMLCNV